MRGLFINVVSHHNMGGDKTIRSTTRIPVTTSSEASLLIDAFSTCRNYQAWLVGVVYVGKHRLYLTATELDLAIDELNEAREQYSEFMEPAPRIKDIMRKPSKPKFPDFDDEPISKTEMEDSDT